MIAQTKKTLKLKFDQNGILLDLPDNWPSSTGFEIADTLGASILDLLHPINRKSLSDWLMNKVEASDRTLQTIRFCDANLDWHWAELIAFKESDDQQIHVELTVLSENNEAEKTIRLAQLEKMQNSWKRIAGPIELDTPKKKINRILFRLREELAIERVVLVKKGEVIALIGGVESSEDILWELEKESLAKLNQTQTVNQWLTTDTPTPLKYQNLKAQLGQQTLFAAATIGDFGLGLSLHVLCPCRQAFRPPLDEAELQLIQWSGERILGFLHQESEEHFERRVKSLANTVFDAVVTINETGFVLEWNNKAEEMFGYTFAEALGQRMSDLIVPDMYRQAHERGMEKFRKTGEGPVLGSRIEIIAQNRAKEVFPIELAITPIDLGDRHIFTGYIRDISYRKDAEQKREKLLSELEKANQELKDFAYIVSHDLKAPLRAIGSLTDWLYEDYRDQLDQDGQDQMELLRERVRRMYRLIEGILAYSRLGRTTENKELVDFNEVLDDVKLGLEIPPDFSIILEDKLPTVEWDRTRAFQVFQNLVSNAIKYNDKEEAWIKISCNDHRTHYRIDFKDNGKGIDSRYFRKIFQIFQTLQPRDEFESTGIGLTLVKKIVEMHGGSIGIDSVLGEGTTFSVKIKKTETEKS